MQKLWTTAVHVHIAIATEVIQLPCSGQQAFFINVEVWLVTLTDEIVSQPRLSRESLGCETTDESEASNRKHVVSLSFVVKE